MIVTLRFAMEPTTPNTPFLPTGVLVGPQAPAARTGPRAGVWPLGERAPAMWRSWQEMDSNAPGWRAGRNRDAAGDRIAGRCRDHLQRRRHRGRRLKPREQRARVFRSLAAGLMPSARQKSITTNPLNRSKYLPREGSCRESGISLLSRLVRPAVTRRVLIPIGRGR